MSTARSTARSTTTKRGVGHLSGAKPSGVIMNRKDLRSVRDLTTDNYNAECMYLRENELTRFDVGAKMDYLRVLDLSINDIGGAVDFLPNTPRLHHLYMTGNKIETLMNISNIASLETLCLSDNAISSFEGLENLPHLRVLSLNFNNISSFQFFPNLPNLHTLNLVGNPITELPSYRSMAIAINGRGLVSIDGNPVQEEERAAVEPYQGKVAHCIRQGFVVEGEDVEEAANAFMLKAQREQEKSKPLQLCAISVAAAVQEGAEEAGNVVVEGVPVRLSLCMQDIRSYTDRTTEIFHSRHLYPVTFQVSGEATEVFVVGSMNGWADPIELERCEKEGEIYFHTTLYLPAGDYEYRYIVDGVEKVSDTNRVDSKCGHGFCNLYQVTAQEGKKDAEDTILHIRWMRSNNNGGFDVVEGQNSLEFVPSLEDVNACLRAEVLAYVKGEFSFLYFDVSAPVVAAPPTCTDLQLSGKPMEGAILKASAHYFGGREGNSTFQWYRVAENGEETLIDVFDPVKGYKVGREAVGHRIRVEFTPRRDDWVTGEPRSAITGIIIAGQPNCESIKIIGSLVEGSVLEAEVKYSGGEEGNSFYQWLRKVEGRRDEYAPINGENATVYTVGAEDVGKFLAVEYTPVNSDGKEGETCRCVLENAIEATQPHVTNLAITGDLSEGQTVTLQYEYSGGRFGAHMIQWYRRDPRKKAPVKIGHPNSNFLTLSAKDVGSSIEVSMTPVRSDGARGGLAQARSDTVVAPADPEIKFLNIIGEPVVDQELGLQVEYAGGSEGNSNIAWEVENPDTLDFEEVAHGQRHYTVRPSDAGKMLRVTYTPIRNDGAQGEPKSRIVQVAAMEQSRHVDPEPAQASPAEEAEEPVPEEQAPEAHPEIAADAEAAEEPAEAAEAPADAEADVAVEAEGEAPAEAPAAEAAEEQPAAAEGEAAEPEAEKREATPPAAEQEAEGEGNIKINLNKTHDSDADSEY